MAEILAWGGIQNAFNDLGIEASMTYQSNHEPYYEVWDINKKDIRTLENVSEWDDEWGSWLYSARSNMGVPYSFFTVRGEFMIGWDTIDGRDTYESLMDYFYNGLGVGLDEYICMYAVDLAKANGKTMSGVFETYEGV